MAFRQAFRAAGRLAQATRAPATISASVGSVTEAVCPALATFTRGFAAEPASAPSVSTGKVTQVSDPGRIAMALRSSWGAMARLQAL